MDELIKLITETNKQLSEINSNLKIRYNKEKTYRITEGQEITEFTEPKDTIDYLNNKYKTNVKVNSLKNLTKLQDVKTKSKYKKVFGESFKFEIV